MKKRLKIDAKPSHQQNSCVENSMNQESIKSSELSDETMNNQEKMKMIHQLFKVLIVVFSFIIPLNNEPCSLLEFRETIEGDRVVREIILNSCNPKN
ncbi:hypothetical protein [Limnoraphis robusta]|uniref:Uncharacterized protein n=1 Tax=Limnoraphis robusta CCNP1315 TaxID=3110306 RepID=A0ABU5U6T7_9CYAN|nr:hypothetical protein [Limnoraphis robusta]MEA5522874.1 hypothetical protein [Limnoraphis robusta CCNP1315]MEA5546864.1 hypothetical protein [Limnoraphis robusta CCNP1324]